MSAHDGRRRGAGTVVAVLVLGLVAGAVLAVVLLGSGLLDLGADEPTATRQTPDDEQEAAPDEEQASGDVPAPCLRAAEANQVVSEGLDEIAVGVRDQDALAVQEALDAIGDVKPGMDADSQECRTLAGSADGSAEDDSSGSGSDEDEDEPSEGESSGDGPGEGEPTPTPTP